MLEQIVRGPLLIPQENGTVDFHRDGAIAFDHDGTFQFVGAFEDLHRNSGLRPPRASDGIMMPPLLDIHTHVPQHPIRGRFVEGVAGDVAGGKLLAGLQRNVFPAEAKCSEAEFAERVVRQFLADTLSHGVVGGAVYMTVSAKATEIALSILPESWSVGLVLMNQNCPKYLRTDDANLDADVEHLASRFGRRLIVTDRFAVAVDTPLRRRASLLAKRFNLRTQTHLNEQVAEKRFVESQLYPQAKSYTDVYRADGLLDHQCIVAHCIQMVSDEWQLVADTGSVIAHCPTSNLLLESGRMPLDEVIARRIPYALGTDVGASPTCSMLAEMRRFIQVHAGYSNHATATEALYRSTLVPAQLLGIDRSFGMLRPGLPASFIEVEPPISGSLASAEDAVRSILPENPDIPDLTVNRVTLRGKVMYERIPVHA
jgi:guanine deaminase